MVGKNGAMPAVWRPGVQQLRNNTTRLADQLRELAHRVGHSEKLSRSERIRMQRYADQLSAAIEELTMVIMVEHRDIAVTANALLSLRAALGIAYWIGCHAIKNPITDRLEQEVKQASAARARNAKAQKSDEIDTVIRELAQPHWSKGTDNYIAGRIQDSVNSRLARPKPLGQSVIAKRLALLRPNV